MSQTVIMCRDEIHLAMHSVVQKTPDTHDSSKIYEGEVPFIDGLVEYAGRLCYKSTAKMNYAKDFIPARIREGHEDILEHGWIAIAIQKLEKYDPIVNTITREHPYFRLHVVDDDGLKETYYVLGGNVRAWRKLLASSFMVSMPMVMIRIRILELIGPLAPKSFRDFGLYSYNSTWGESPIMPLVYNNFSPRTPYEFQSVHLIGISAIENRRKIEVYPTSESYSQIGHASFIIEGISRSCSHQLVRNRLGSFSQESQRYVDMNKAIDLDKGPGYVTPPGGNRDKYARAWNLAMESYNDLRSSDMKEDARFVIPNMAATRLVMSGPYDMWKTFLWQRCDPAAQWEIRNVALSILELLYEADPHEFGGLAMVFLLK